MRIVITGATSFVGAAVIQELLENGHEVYAVVRPSSRKLETLTGHEAGKNALREAVSYTRLDVYKRQGYARCGWKEEWRDGGDLHR